MVIDGACLETEKTSTIEIRGGSHLRSNVTLNHFDLIVIGSMFFSLTGNEKIRRNEMAYFFEASNDFFK